MKTRNLIFILTGLIIGSTNIHAQSPDLPFPSEMRKHFFKHGPMGEKMARKGDHLKMILRRLDLTDEQKTDIKAIIEANRETIREQSDIIADLHKQLRELTETTAQDAAEVSNLSQALGDAIVNKAYLRSDLKEQIKSLLTDEQKVKFEEIRLEMKEQINERMERRKELMKERRGLFESGEYPNYGKNRRFFRGDF